MEYRKLTLADIQAFREIRVEMCQNHPGAFNQTPEEVDEMGDDKIPEWVVPSDTFPQGFIMAAFENGRLLGTAGFKREDTFKERHRGWIWAVYVRPEGRGKGISRELMIRLIEEARKIDGLEIISLIVSLTQPEARTLYTSLGFFTTGLILKGFKLADNSYIDLEDMMLIL
jgi:GNAT superfamily N-acetyltransferase